MYELKDTYVLSLNKERFELNFYYPCFICNSPFDRSQEAMVILNSRKQMKETSFEHFYSIFTYRNPYQKQYRTIDFEIMGNNFDLWADQFKNDLENLFTNQNLQLIGGYSNGASSNEFKFVMYETVENYSVNSKFDLHVDTLFGHITAEQLEDFLNQKYSKEMYVFVSVFTILKSINSKQILEDTSQIMHLIVFQDMKINFVDYDKTFRFVVKTFPFIDIKMDKEDALMKYIEKQSSKEHLELLGVFPGFELSDSLIIFAQNDDSIQSN